MLKKQAQTSAKEVIKTVSNAKKMHAARTAQIRTVLARADQQLSEMEKEAKTTVEQIGYLDDIDKQMTSVWAKWYESGEKEWNKNKDEKKFKHADGKVQEEEKRAMLLVKDIKDRAATISEQVEKHEAAVKGVMDKLW